MSVHTRQVMHVEITETCLCSGLCICVLHFALCICIAATHLAQHRMHKILNMKHKHIFGIIRKLNWISSKMLWFCSHYLTYNPAMHIRRAICSLFAVQVCPFFFLFFCSDFYFIFFRKTDNSLWTTYTHLQLPLISLLQSQCLVRGRCTVGSVHPWVSWHIKAVVFRGMWVWIRSVPCLMLYPVKWNAKKKSKTFLLYKSNKCIAIKKLFRLKNDLKKCIFVHWPTSTWDTWSDWCTAAVKWHSDWTWAVESRFKAFLPIC